MIAPAAVGCKRWSHGALGTHKQEKWTIQVLARPRHFSNERIIDVIVTPLEVSKAGI
jgi:hypothetical protein